MERDASNLPVSEVFGVGLDLSNEDLVLSDDSDEDEEDSETR